MLTTVWLYFSGHLTQLVWVSFHNTDTAHCLSEMSLLAVLRYLVYADFATTAIWAAERSWPESSTSNGNMLGLTFSAGPRCDFSKMDWFFPSGYQINFSYFVELRCLSNFYHFWWKLFMLLSNESKLVTVGCRKTWRWFMEKQVIIDDGLCFCVQTLTFPAASVVNDQTFPVSSLTEFAYLMGFL